MCLPTPSGVSIAFATCPNYVGWQKRFASQAVRIVGRGFVRHCWYGELNWQGAQGEQWMSRKIEELLGEEG